MPPMEPSSEMSTFISPAPYSTNAISATAPVLTDDSISSPEPTVPTFPSSLVCSSSEMLASGREHARPFISSSGHYGLQNSSQSLCNQTRAVFTPEMHHHITNNNAYTTGQALCGHNRNESSPSLSFFTKSHPQDSGSTAAFGSQCLRYNHTVNPGRSHTVKYRPSGSSSSISSCSSSNSPGINRRHSNVSLGKSSSSADEDMSTNPNTPNTPKTPLTPCDTGGKGLNNTDTIFNFPITVNHTNSNSNINGNITTATNNQDNQFAPDCEGLDLDFDLDGDDDVFCSDINAIPTSINPFSIKTTVESNVSAPATCFDMGNYQNKNNVHHYNLGNKNATAAATATTTNINCPASSTLCDSAFLSQHQHISCVTKNCSQNKDKDNTDMNSLASSSDSKTNTVNDTFPALLSDALRVCEKDELGEGRDSNNNDSNNICSSSTTTTTTTSETLSPSSSPNPALLNAALEAYQSGQITPLLKHELKWVIQLRRLSQGKEEMEVSFDPPTVSQMSEAELTRAERRRRQNRIAARKFRQKRKSVEEQLLQTIQALKETNSTLEQKAEQLRREKQVLMEFMADHLLVCPFLSHLQLETLAIGDDTQS